MKDEDLCRLIALFAYKVMSLPLGDDLADICLHERVSKHAHLNICNGSRAI
jgi:hypothetical protein